MSKDQLGLLVLFVGLLGTVLTAGMRIGTLTERIDAQRAQLELLTKEIAAINHHFIAYAALHRAEGDRR